MDSTSSRCHSIRGRIDPGPDHVCHEFHGAAGECWICPVVARGLRPECLRARKPHARKRPHVAPVAQGLARGGVETADARHRGETGRERDRLPRPGSGILRGASACPWPNPADVSPTSVPSYLAVASLAALKTLGHLARRPFPRLRLGGCTRLENASRVDRHADAQQLDSQCSFVSETCAKLGQRLFCPSDAIVHTEECAGHGIDETVAGMAQYFFQLLQS